MSIDDDCMPAGELASGHADSNVAPTPTEFDGVRAVLWLPDPESRHGWREFYVREPEKKKPGGRVGF